MPSPWNEALENTVRYLEQKRARGEQTIQVDRSLLAPSRAPAASVNPPPFKRAAVSDKSAAYERIVEEIRACVKCPHLVSFRKQVVPGVGSLDATIMFVGEAPGADEDKEGEPFVGRAGQLLTRVIQTMGLQREDVFIANILKCRPNVDTPFGNRKPTAEEMETCLPFLHRQIELIGPRVLVALGDTAVKGLVPGLSAGITRLRGTWLQFGDIPLMPTYHPAYLLRNPSLTVKRQCWEDMLAVMERIQMPVTQKQRDYFLSLSSNSASA